MLIITEVALACIGQLALTGNKPACPSRLKGAALDMQHGLASIAADCSSGFSCILAGAAETLSQDHNMLAISSSPGPSTLSNTIDLCHFVNVGCGYGGQGQGYLGCVEDAFSIINESDTFTFSFSLFPYWYYACLSSGLVQYLINEIRHLNCS